jgi:hypothetical protein
MFTNFHVIIPEGIFSTENDRGDKIIFNYNNGQYYGLDKMGAHYWNLINEHKDLNKVINITLNKFDIDKDTVIKDLSKLIEHFEREGLVQLS